MNAKNESYPSNQRNFDSVNIKYITVLLKTVKYTEVSRKISPWNKIGSLA